MSDMPPPLPPKLPPMITEAAPPRPPARIKVILFSLGAGALFLFNLTVKILQGLAKLPNGLQVPFLTGFIMGGIIVPPVIILCIASLWKCNRRPYVMLQWFFWIMLVTACSKVAMIATWITTMEPK